MACLLTPDDSPPDDNYARRLITIQAACAEFGLGRTAFWNFRRRHGIQKLSGGRVHRDDVIRGFEDDRCRDSAGNEEDAQ